MSSREAPKPLTEEQRNHVRSLLKQLGESSLRRSNSVRKTPRKSSKHLSLKYLQPKVQESPFDGIDEGQTVDGIGLPVVCNTMPVVQRVRLMLVPLFYDDIPIDRDEIIKMVKEDLGCDLSIADSGTKQTLRFVVDGNPPIKILYIYLKPCETDDSKYVLLNWMYAT
jgi:hypothetical protein